MPAPCGARSPPANPSSTQPLTSSATPPADPDSHFNRSAQERGGYDHRRRGDVSGSQSDRATPKELEARYTFEDIVGRSPAMTSLFEILPQIAESDSTVLIEGASGTGKELFARRFTTCPAARRSVSWPSTAQPCRIRSWNQSFSATKPAPSPMRAGTSPAVSNWLTVALSSWTKSVTSHQPCRYACSVCCRSGASNLSARSIQSR
jgi:hypothetical protein